MPIVDLLESVIVMKEVIATGEFHVTVVEGEYSVFEPELLIVALVSPTLAEVALSHFCPTELV